MTCATSSIWRAICCPRRRSHSGFAAECWRWAVAIQLRDLLDAHRSSVPIDPVSDSSHYRNARCGCAGLPGLHRGNSALASSRPVHAPRFRRVAVFSNRQADHRSGFRLSSVARGRSTLGRLDTGSDERHFEIPPDRQRKRIGLLENHADAATQRLHFDMRAVNVFAVDGGCRSSKRLPISAARGATVLEPVSTSLLSAARRTGQDSRATATATARATNVK